MDFSSNPFTPTDRIWAPRLVTHPLNPSHFIFRRRDRDTGSIPLWSENREALILRVFLS